MRIFQINLADNASVKVLHLLLMSEGEGVLHTEKRSAGANGCYEENESNNLTSLDGVQKHVSILSLWLVQRQIAKKKLVARNG